VIEPFFRSQQTQIDEIALEFHPADVIVVVIEIRDVQLQLAVSERCPPPGNFPVGVEYQNTAKGLIGWCCRGAFGLAKTLVQLFVSFQALRTAVDGDSALRTGWVVRLLHGLEAVVPKAALNWPPFTGVYWAGKVKQAEGFVIDVTVMEVEFVRHLG